MRSFTLRPATESDQPIIVFIVNEGRINPRGLGWPNFIVAESEGKVVGVGQVKQHGDGSRELASIAVRPPFKRQGIGNAICRTLIERESSTLYLMCRGQLESYYTRFGFRKIGPDEMPPYFRRIHRLVSTANVVAFGNIKFAIMKRERPMP
ncbi:MAG: GNAT family N-acetyltransferase [Chloroflexi bacterium]|nr:GNAT family N-acetyltransferase [Chloroflexota bacterium]